MNFETLEFKREGNIGILTINRPKALNALNAQVIQDLKSFLTQVKSEKGLRALILTDSSGFSTAGIDWVMPVASCCPSPGS